MKSAVLKPLALAVAIVVLIATDAGAAVLVRGTLTGRRAPLRRRSRPHYFCGSGGSR